MVLLERFLLACTVNADNRLGTRIAYLGEIFARHGVLVLLAQVPFACGRSIVRQQIIYALGILRLLRGLYFGVRGIPLDGLPVLIAPEEQFRLFFPEHDVLPVFAGGPETDPDDDDRHKQGDVGETPGIAECGMRNAELDYSVNS